MLLNPHLTKPQGDDLAAKQFATFPGQAFWAKTGPEGKTCRECLFWSCSPSYKRDEEGNLLARRCRKFPRLSGGIEGDGIPHDAFACRYFEQAEKPATIEGRNSPKPEKAAA